MQFRLKSVANTNQRDIDTIFEYVHYKTIFDKAKDVEKATKKLKEVSILLRWQAWIDKNAKTERA